MKKILLSLAVSVTVFLACLYITPKLSASAALISDLDSVCFQKIEQYSDGENYEIQTKSNLLDFAGHNYFLYELLPQGYLILEGTTGEMTEGSFQAQSPYSQCEVQGEYFYLGYMNYFVKTGNEYYHITDAEYYPFCEEMVFSSNQYFKTITQYAKDNKADDQRKSRSANVEGDGGGSNTDTAGFTVIKNADYFRELSNFPNNSQGSCGFVALSMYLGYLDTFNAPYVIDPTQLSLAYNETFKKEDLKVTELSDIQSYKDWVSSPGTGQSMETLLLDYGHYFPIGDNSPAMAGQLNATYEDYVSDYFGDKANQFESFADSFFNTHKKPKAFIDKGIPVIILMTSYTYIDNGVSIDSNGLAASHSVIAYGYKDDMFLTHFGWIPESTDYAEILVSNATIQSYLAIWYKGELIHTDNYTWTCHGSSGFYCPCGYIYGCDHQGEWIAQARTSDFEHEIICATCKEVMSIEKHVYELRGSAGAEYFYCTHCDYRKNVDDFLEIHCRKNIQDTIYHSNRYRSYLLKLNSLCEVLYEFSVQSSQEVMMTLYDENLTIVKEGIFNPGSSYQKWMDKWLEKKTYYLELRIQGEFFTIATRPHDGAQRENISSKAETDALTHLHDNHNEFSFSAGEEGFYYFKLIAVKNGQVFYPQGTILIKDSNGNIINKCESAGYFYKAESIEGSNNLLFYAKKWESFFIYIEYETEGLQKLILSVAKKSAFEKTIIGETDQYQEIAPIRKGDHIEILRAERIGNYQLRINYQGNQQEPMLFVIYEKRGNDLFTFRFSYLIRYNSSPITYMLSITEPTELMVCYFDSFAEGNLSISLKKEVTTPFELKTDPNLHTIGTEVTLNNGACNGSLMTVGFTRICYLGKNAPDLSSRLNYYWYSVDSSVARVSAYGTVTAVGVGTTTIQAVYKKDTSKVGYFTITVLANNDTQIKYLSYGMDLRVEGTLSGTEVTSGNGSAIEIASNPEVTIHRGYTRLICLGADSPSSSIQDFEWRAYRESGDSGMVNVSSFGTINAVTSGYVTVEGTYLYNPNYKVLIRIQVI